MKHRTKRERKAADDAAAFSELSFLASCVHDRIAKKRAYEDCMQAGGAGESLYRDLGSLSMFLNAWNKPVEGLSFPPAFYEALDQAHKLSFGDGRKWKRETAVKEVSSVINALMQRIRYNKFLLEARELARDHGFSGKLHIALVPEPTLPNPTDMTTFQFFLKELMKLMKKAPVAA